MIEWLLFNAKLAVLSAMSLREQVAFQWDDDDDDDFHNVLDKHA